MMFLFNSFMASFSPVSFGQSKDLFTSVGKGAVPTVMKPFVDVMVNETYFGGPVTGENLPFGVQRPESELAFRSPEAVKDFFKWMNEATGGSEFKSGDLDFNPDKFWYMFQYYIGGAGQFVDRSLFQFPKQLQAKLFSGEDVQIDAGQVPLVESFTVSHRSTSTWRSSRRTSRSSSPCTRRLRSHQSWTTWRDTKASTLVRTPCSTRSRSNSRC